MNIAKYKSFIVRNKVLVQGFCIALFVFIMDQITKYFAFKAVTDVIIRTGRMQNSIKVTEFFNISKVWNTGVSFGMFRNMYASQVILSAITILIIVILIYWMMKINKMYLMVAVGVVLGGAFGNLYDRIKFGAVRDFLDFHLGTWHWPSFNIADSAVCIGVFIILLDDLFLKRRFLKNIHRRRK